MTPFLRLSAGAVAGTIAMSATYPLDMVRGRLTVQLEQTGQYRGIMHCTRQIIAQVGQDWRCSLQHHTTSHVVMNESFGAASERQPKAKWLISLAFVLHLPRSTPPK